jgi:hypothetical protein
MGIVFLYSALLGLFVFGLMAWDMRSAYAAARDLREKLLANLEGVSVDQRRSLVSDLSQALPGIPGLARSTLALALLLILGITVFHLVTFGGPGFAPGESGKLVHDLAMLLGSAVTSVAAFYFGGRAVQEGAAGATTQPKAPPSASASITKVTPDHGATGTEVIITGTGFGQSPGQVRFANVDAPAATWTETSIKTKVPSGLTQGAALTITVNPFGGAAATSSFTLT